MPYQIKQLSGVMNTDDPVEDIPLPHHKRSRNIRFRNGRPESIVGNTIINFNPPSGTNENVGAFYSGVRQYIIFMNRNSNGNDGIYKYDVNTQVTTPLLVCGTNSTGNILNFDLDNFIADIDILYTTTGEGDILHWVQRNTEAKRLNIKEAEDNKYGSAWLASYLTVIKAPQKMPPKVVYENDTTVTVNNIRNAIYQFAQINWYSNFEKSVWSHRSIQPLPFQPSLQLTQDTFTNNARISVSMNTGDASVFKFGLAFRQTKDGSVSDWFLIDTFDKAALSIGNNDIYTYKFKNDSLYTPLVDPDDGDITQLQDYVQRQPKSQALLNGNVLELAGGIEGFDPVDPSITMTVGTDTGGFFYDYNGLLFFATINGTDSGASGTTMKVYVFGTGTNTTGVVTTLNNAKATFVINAVNSSTLAPIGVSVANATDSVTVATLLTNVSAALVINGWTQTSLSGNVLTMAFAAGATLYSSGTKLTTTSAQENTTGYAWPFESAAQTAVMYFDPYGRTNGAFTNLTATFPTAALSTAYNYPQPLMIVSGRPPLWATEWSPVRINNTVYAKRLEWVSQSAFSSGLVAPPGMRFAYLGISNIADYNTEITATQGVVSYSFAQGDRVRMYSRYDITGTVTNLTTIVDYEILGVETNPKIDGVVKVGTFVKIYYPTADIDSNLKFDGTDDFLHYKILLYALKQHAIGGSNNVFYEFGKRFAIGNAGTATAYHIGLNQTQSPNLATPAQVNIVNGDLFWRQRTVPYNESFTYAAGGTDQDTSATMLITVPTTVNNAAYQIQSQAEASIVSLTNPASYPTYGDTPFFYNKAATAGLSRLVRLRASFTVYNNVPEISTWAFGVVICTSLVPFAAKYYTVLSHPNPTITVQPSATQIIEIDTIVSVPPTGKMFPVMESTSASTGNINVINSADFTIEVLNSSTIEIIESSFSDVYKLETNSNGRETIVDPNAKEAENPVLIRWSLPYQDNTNINGANNFRFLNFDQVDRSAGAIQRTIFFKKKLIVFQETKSGRYGVYSKYIRNNSNQNELVVTDEILTKNNMQYYESGEYGLGKQYTAMCYSENAVYFVHPITGSLLRISGDGITNLSELYKGQFELSNLMDKYNKTYLRPDGSKAKIMMFFDNFEEQAMVILQGGTNSGVTIPNEAFSFNENRNGFCSFYDYFNPDNMLCAKNTTFAFKGGRGYIHNNETTYCNFFGTQYYPSILLVFNDQKAIKKNFLAVSYQGNNFWIAPTNGDVTTAGVNGQTDEIQVSKLPDWVFDFDENRRVASFLRDINSMADPDEALNNGDFLQSFSISVNFVSLNSSFSWMFLPTLLWTPNNKNA